MKIKMGDIIMAASLEGMGGIVALTKSKNLHPNWDTYITRVLNLPYITEAQTEGDVVLYARSFCYAVTKSLWKRVDYQKKVDCREYGKQINYLDNQTLKLTSEIADYLFTLNIMEYAYRLGSLYTTLLPDSYKSENGIYYTPPALAERLLDLLTVEGADWAQAEVLDPACGGGAFLVTVANRMLGDYRIGGLSSNAKITFLEDHLAGIELDEFAAWLTQVLLDIIVYRETVDAGRRLNPQIIVQDTLQYALGAKRKFDVIVGNPPFGRIKLDEKTRSAYDRSLFGHANLYGVFIDASLRMKKDNGLVGFVTPTSFLGGKYFSNLRDLLAKAAPPLALDFVATRAGVFDQVLQETCLAVFGPNPARSVMTNKFTIEKDKTWVDRIGSFTVKKGTAPWVLARETAEAEILSHLTDDTATLTNYGYKVSTGQLVWNRHKKQIRKTSRNHAKPIIWAEAITSGGEFDFDYEYRSNRKFIRLNDTQNFLLTKKTSVLVQRTTAKEQSRRLQTCVLPQSFIDKWSGVVVENHVNIIQPIVRSPAITLETVSLLLNSEIVDRVFRCLSGSVAVSVTELHAIPLPPVTEMKRIEVILTNKKKKLSNEQIEKLVQEAYGLGESYAK